MSESPYDRVLYKSLPVALFTLTADFESQEHCMITAYLKNLTRHVIALRDDCRMLGEDIDRVQKLVGHLHREQHRG